MSATMPPVKDKANGNDRGRGGQQQQPRRRSRSRSRSAALPSSRRLATATGESDRSYTYSEIREAYNISSAGTLPPGATTRNGSVGSGSNVNAGRPRSEGGGDFSAHERMASDLASRAGTTTINSGGTTTNNTGMSTRMMGNGANGNGGGRGRVVMPRRRSKSFTDLSVPMDACSSGGSNNNKSNTRNNHDHDNYQGYASDGGGIQRGGISKKRSGFGVRRDSFGRVSARINSKRQSNSRQIGVGEGGHASDAGSARRGPRDPPSGSVIPNGVNIVTDNISDITGSESREDYKKRHSFDGAPRPKRIRDIIARTKSQRRPSLSDPGNGLDVGGFPSTQQRLLSIRSQRGLKALPENASVRDSNRFAGGGMFEKQKDLNSMTLNELKAELVRQGISVEGAFEREDLISICAQKRKKKGAGENGAAVPHGGVEGLARAALAGISTHPNPPGKLERRDSKKSLNNGSNHSSKSKKGGSSIAGRIRRDSLCKEAKQNGIVRARGRSADGERGGNTDGVRNPARTCSTFDEIDLGGGRSGSDNFNASHYSANPQQGMSSFNLSGGGTGPSKPSRRLSKGSSISSIGDSLEPNGEMAVVNAPLGVGLSGFGQDVRNPNQQMGLLLRQMQQLEDQMTDNPKATEARMQMQVEAAQQRRNSGSHKNVEGDPSSTDRRLTNESGHSAQSGGGGRGKRAGWKSQRQMSCQSMYSGIYNNGDGDGGGGGNFARRDSGGSRGSFVSPPSQWRTSESGDQSLYVGTDGSFHGGPPSREGSRKDLMNRRGSRKDLMGRQGSRKDLPKQGSRKDLEFSTKSLDFDRGRSTKDFDSSCKSLNFGPGGGGRSKQANSPPPSVVMSTLSCTAPSEIGSDKALADAEKHAKKKVVSTKGCCSCSKRCMAITAFLIFLVGGCVAAALLVFVFDVLEKDENASDEASGVGAQAAPTASPAPSPLGHLAPPLPDIEGRCSPSNLPGSLPACLAACLPSQCCYPAQHAIMGSCVDDSDERTIEACGRYKPYCDVFYETWPGAESGELRSPPASIVAMCAANAAAEGSANLEEGGGDVNPEVSGNATAIIGAGDEVERPMESFERKRLRGQQRSFERHPSGRSLLVPGLDEICEQHCRSARCCHAPAHVAGTVLSASGVHTNSTNGEHVVTNCQQDFGKNAEPCDEYDKFCGDVFSTADDVDDGAPRDGMSDNGTPTHAARTSIPTPAPTRTGFVRPSLSPSASSMPSPMPTNNVFAMTFLRPTSSLKQSSAPSTSSPPTAPKIPPASTLEIAAACSGAEKEAKISEGEDAALVGCFSACGDGLCCYSEMLGLTAWMPSCFEGNEGTCLEYSPCLVLGKENEAPAAGIAESNATAADVLAESPPIPAANLTSLCSHESISTLAGLSECAFACEAGSCCNAPEAELSCQVRNPGTCALYQPCANLDSRSGLPPPAASNLSAACSHESLVTSGNECHEQCQPGNCCSDSTCLKRDQSDVSQAILDDLDDICETYQPCYNLFLVSSPPNFEKLCDGSNRASDDCATICSAVSCCFSGSSPHDDHTSSASCYIHFEEKCNFYAPYCFVATPAAVDVPPPPQNFALLCQVSAAFCRKECEVASCCFETSPELSCVANNKERCEDYAPCDGL